MKKFGELPVGQQFRLSGSDETYEKVSNASETPNWGSVRSLTSGEPAMFPNWFPVQITN